MDVAAEQLKEVVLRDRVDVAHVVPVGGELSLARAPVPPPRADEWAIGHDGFKLVLLFYPNSFNDSARSFWYGISLVL